MGRKVNAATATLIAGARTTCARQKKRNQGRLLWPTSCHHYVTCTPWKRAQRVTRHRNSPSNSANWFPRFGLIPKDERSNAYRAILSRTKNRSDTVALTCTRAAARAQAGNKVPFPILIIRYIPCVPSRALESRPSRTFFRAGERRPFQMNVFVKLRFRCRSDHLETRTATSPQT